MITCNVQKDESVRAFRNRRAAAPAQRTVQGDPCLLGMPSMGGTTNRHRRYSRSPLCIQTTAKPAVLRQPRRRWRVCWTGIDTHRPDRGLDLRLRHRPTSCAFHPGEGPVAQLGSQVRLGETQDARRLGEVVDDGNHCGRPWRRRCASWAAAGASVPAWGLVGSPSRTPSEFGPSPKRDASQAVTSLSRCRACLPRRA